MARSPGMADAGALPPPKPVVSSSGVQLGHIAGIEVIADWSLLIIFVLIAFSLSAGVFPSWHPDWGPGLALSTAVGAAFLFLASVLAHELSHAVVGRMVGIRVSRVTLFMLGGMAHMETEPPTWRAELVMAAIGPITSLALGLAFLSLSGFFAGPIELDPDDPAAMLGALSAPATLLFWLGTVNIMLAVFNLVPGFPLDGGRILRAALWGATRNLRKATRWASWGGQAFAWLLIGAGLLMLLGFSIPWLGRGAFGGLWLMLLGWFLNNAALVSYRQLLIKETLEGVPVERVMQKSLTRVDPGFSVRRLVDEQLMASGQRVIPVEEGGRFVGIVCLADLQKSDRRNWDRLTAADIMTPVAGLATVSPREDTGDALALLAKRDVNQLPVVEAGRLLGLLRREDVLKWLSLHQPGAEI